MPDLVELCDHRTVELRQLRYFVRVVELGSMGRAALDLQMVQSTLSQQISWLEGELSTRLLQRTSKGTVPTEARLAFFREAQLTLRHADQAARVARQARLSGTVTVGLAPTTASVLGMSLMRAMRERYPDVWLHMVESPSGHLSNMPYVYKSLPYKAEDFVPVVRVLSVVTSVQSPYKTLGELMAAAKASPGKLNYASYGIGQGTHVALARLLNAAGATMVHVPYKDSAMPDLMAGLVTTIFEPATTAIPNIQAGKLLGLAVSGPRRIEALPNVPAINETYGGFVGDSWHGLLAPKGTPADVVARLNGAAQKIIASPDFQRRLKDLGLVPAGGTPEDFRKFLQEDA